MKDIICWWSGGITSAIACKLAIDLYGEDRCRVVFIDTKNEHDDVYRFMQDCEKLYNLPIETISSIPSHYESIEDVWYKHKQLNTANGAICSNVLKRKARERWEKDNTWTHQVFGFETDKKELNRAIAMKLDHAHTKPIFPLLMFGMTKEDCIEYIKPYGIELPIAYRLGFSNSNCLKSFCISGGIGYWQKIQREFPEQFSKMAKIEHDLTSIRGYQVTMLKDQSKEAKQKIKDTGDKRAHLVFLKKHPDYPYNKCIDDMEGREPKPLTDCNGFCGLDDMNGRNPTELELNYQD
jgi:3'-phosphoadenosine 5'-phosphosulfate sulfotransferase (PAPS reductase)/FAD synthetase